MLLPWIRQASPRALIQHDDASCPPLWKPFKVLIPCILIREDFTTLDLIKPVLRERSLGHRDIDRLSHKTWCESLSLLLLLLAVPARRVLELRLQLMIPIILIKNIGNINNWAVRIFRMLLWFLLRDSTYVWLIMLILRLLSFHCWLAALPHSLFYKCIQIY